MTDYLDDDELGAALRSEVPERPDDYWAAIEATLTHAAADSEFGSTEFSSTAFGSTDTGATDISAGGSTPLRPSRSDEANAPAGVVKRLRSWPVLAAAAALIIVGLVLSLRLLPSNGETVDTGFASDRTLAELEALPGPTQNVDHWHSVYGVWDCTADDGTGAWVPPFQSTQDDWGVHSHGDGLVSLHPFFEESAGKNATFGLFAESMNFEVTADAITLDDGRMLTAGTTCGGEPAVIQMRRWQSAPDLERDPSIAPMVITEGFDEQRYYNDLEVWTIALAPLDADIPLPPRERFDELARWWFPASLQLPPGLTLDAVINDDVPLEDGYSGVRLVNSGAAADTAIQDLLSRSREFTAGDLPLVDASLVSGSGRHWVAASRHAQVAAELFTYEILDEAAGLAPTLTCQMVALPGLGGRGGGGCTRSDDPLVGLTRTTTDTFSPGLDDPNALIDSVALWNAPTDTAWMIVYTTGGRRMVSEVVDGTSYAAWPAEDGELDTAAVFTANGDLVWGDAQR